MGEKYHTTISFFKTMLKESSLFVGGNGIKLPLAHKLRDDYEGSALKVFV